MKSVPYAFLAGAGYGLLMRVIFGLLSDYHINNTGAGGPMLASFVVLVPAIIGVITVYMAEQRTWLYSIFGPWLPVTAFALGTGLLLFEGGICIAMALPIFLLTSSIAGIITQLVMRYWRPSRNTLRTVVILPVFLGIAESSISLPQTHSQVVESIYIAAPADIVWQQIENVDMIQPKELQTGLVYKIGVPYPLAAHTTINKLERIRHVTWGKGVAFDEVLTNWDKNRYLRWTYRFNPESFPAGSMDEHVVIGGKYFDLIDTSYRLVPSGNGTRLETRITYRVSTNFNWYAKTVGQVLIKDTAQTLLRFYKYRSEQFALSAFPSP